MEKISDDKIKQYKETFDLFDHDADGAISVKDLQELLKSFKSFITDEEAQEMINRTSKNKDGMLRFPEFMKMMAKGEKKSEAEEELVSAFKVFDKNGDGFISPAELKETITSIGEKLSDDEIKTMFSQADIDGDGLIDYEEFVKMMMSR